MAVRLIPNQLVKLYKTQDFNTVNKRRTQDYRQYCQLVREEQTTMFQVELLPDTESLITNGDFVSDISSWQVVYPTWQWASGRLQGEVSGAGQPNIYQQITTVVGRVYKLTLTIQFTNLSSRLTVIAAQSTLPTWVYEASDYGTLPFTVEVYFTADLVNAQITFILQGNVRDLVYIDDVSVERLSAPTATLEDCNGNLIETLATFAQSGNIAVFAVEWFGKAEGCYRICLEDTEDTEANYLDRALALGTEGGAPIELEQGGFLKWFG